MNPIEVLKEEHEAIGLELDELDFIMGCVVINYSNLVHTFVKLCGLWDLHEEKEEGVFGVMKRENVRVPAYKMTCEHGAIRGHIEGFKSAVNSGSDFEIRKSFDRDLRIFIEKLRAHIETEDEILYTISEEEFSEEEWEEMGRALLEAGGERRGRR